MGMDEYIGKILSIFYHVKQLSHASPLLHQQSMPKSLEEWCIHWQKQNQPWRTQPEIPRERQQELSKRFAIVPNIEKGLYPFRGILLNRADIEWLLATHENGRGPVDWTDEKQRSRKGLDLRGADLRYADLQKLPLARLRGALTWREAPDLTKEQRRAAEVLLEDANLKQTHLEGAILAGVHLEKADLGRTRLEGAYLIRVHLEGAGLSEVHLERANLTGAYMERALLRRTYLADENHIGPRLVDIHWGDTNLAIVDWTQVKMLDDEYRARQKTYAGKVKDKALRISEYETAVRANRQLAVALENQGLNEDAARFAFRAQVLQRKLVWMRHEFGRWSFSMMLALLTGYGYRMWRIIVAYALIVCACAVAYFILGLHYGPHLSLMQAFLESVTAFHGRVFLELFTSNTPQIWVTAFEAVAGLVIEGVFIAMLTQRFFGK